MQRSFADRFHTIVNDFDAFGAIVLQSNLCGFVWASERAARGLTICAPKRIEEHKAKRTDTGRASVDGVLDQLFDRGRQIQYHLARTDLVNRLGVDFTNRAAHSIKCICLLASLRRSRRRKHRARR